ncbi:MFS transporter [Pseudolysinimonas yzui]|uniref:MFS transporter n=1 Tax=Pseudolysinimonas yzui TaxID=2708254 RepID=UPI00174DA0B1|nr:MFS transporter [Pseudolysinimonas yzui]
MASTTAAESTAPAVAAPVLVHRPGGVIDNWDPENHVQWEGGGRAIAQRNLRWSIFAEFLGFIVWQLWSIVVVQLPAAGFTFDIGQTFWLISMPALVGATLRLPYTFLVPKVGGRNWTIISAALLLIPSISLGFAVSNPETPFGVMLFIAALAGFGGGNFASSMSNINFFFPQREKGYALGLNAAGGNIGVAVAQIVVPFVIIIGAVGTTKNLAFAGWFWIPFILIAIFGAYKFMNNLSNAKADFAASAAALRDPHTWIMSILYIGTFGSFIGFAGVFPKVIQTQFPELSNFQIGAAGITLAFLGALVGSLSRPFGGKLADRFGGAKITVFAFTAMAVGALAVVLTLPVGNFWLFLGTFLFIFAATGIGNGSTYRMIPSIFSARSGVEDAHNNSGDVSTTRKTSAAIGIISAIGAYGGFIIPQVLGASLGSTGSYATAIYGFVGAYVVFIAMTLFFYMRRGSKLGQRV